MEWYVSAAGLKAGPFSTAEMVQKVVSGEFDERALVWKEGFPSWQPLAVHFKQHNIRTPGTSNTSTDSSNIGHDRNANKHKKSSFANSLKRYWHGGYPMAVSFGLVSILGSIGLLVSYTLLGYAFGETEYAPYRIIAFVGVSWLLAIAWTTFQFVGTWRSASAHGGSGTSQKHAVQSILTRVALGIGTACMGVAFVLIGLPQLMESSRIAFWDDPDIASYNLRLMRNGTELEVAGGFKYGLADDVERVLRASPQVVLIHLNSDGGRIGEATKLAKVIRSSKLATYTASRCLSACAIAYAAGRQRWILDGARLGYHSGSFGGQNIVSSMRDTMLKEGFSREFVEIAVSYPAQKMWYPSSSELSEYGIITGTVDTYKFAASGYGVKPGSEDFAAQLRKLSIYRAIERTNPSLFGQVSTEFQQKYIDGYPEGIIVDTMREKLVPYIQQNLYRADDKTLAEYAALIADQYQALGQINPRICHSYATSKTETDIYQHLSRDLRSRELALSERVVLSTNTRRSFTQSQLDALYEKIFDKLSKQHPANQLTLLATPEAVKPDQYATYCRLVTAMFREIAQLAPREAGAVMSALFNEASSSKTEPPASSPPSRGTPKR